MTASSLTAALLLAGNEGCLSVVHKCMRPICALTTGVSRNPSSHSRRRFPQNEAAKLDPIIFRVGRAAKRNDDDEDDTRGKNSNREAYFITVHVAKDDDHRMTWPKIFTVLPGHSNPHLLHFSTIKWSEISPAHGRSRSDDGLPGIYQSAELSTAANSAARGTYFS